MGRKKARPFIKVDQWIMKTQAWRNLSANARAIYLELLLRFNGTNNGTIGLGCRDAADAIHVGKSTAGRAFKELEDHGFISVGTPSGFNVNGRKTSEWVLTAFVDNRTGKPAVLTFKYWTLKENPSPTSGTVSPTSGTQRSSEPLCVPPQGHKPLNSDCSQSHHRDTYIYIPEGEEKNA
jgi:hypothetical protein